MRRFVILGLMLAVLAAGTSAFGQALGDVARANREAKKSNGGRHAQVYNDDDNPLPSRIPLELIVSYPPPYSKEQADAGFERILGEAAKLAEKIVRGDREPDELPFIIALFEDQNALTTAQWRTSVTEYRDLKEKRCRNPKSADEARDSAKLELLKEQIKGMFRDQTIVQRRREESIDSLKGQVSPYSWSLQKGREGLWRLDWTSAQMERDLELFDMPCEELLSYLRH